MEQTVNCPKCGEPRKRFTSHTAKNPGRNFYSCKPCGWFSFEDKLKSTRHKVSSEVHEISHDISDEKEKKKLEKKTEIRKNRMLTLPSHTFSISNENIESGTLFLSKGSTLKGNFEIQVKENVLQVCVLQFNDDGLFFDGKKILSYDHTINCEIKCSDLCLKFV